MNDSRPQDDPFAHLKRQAGDRSERTVERTSAGIAALRASGRKITAESLKQATREFEALATERLARPTIHSSASTRRSWSTVFVQWRRNWTPSAINGAHSPTI